MTGASSNIYAILFFFFFSFLSHQLAYWYNGTIFFLFLSIGRSARLLSFDSTIFLLSVRSHGHLSFSFSFPSQTRCAMYCDIIFFLRPMTHTLTIYHRSSQTIFKFIIFPINKTKFFATLADYCTYLVLNNYKVWGRYIIQFYRIIFWINSNMENIVKSTQNNKHFFIEFYLYKWLENY